MPNPEIFILTQYERDQTTKQILICSETAFRKKVLTEDDSVEFTAQLVVRLYHPLQSLKDGFQAALSITLDDMCTHEFTHTVNVPETDKDYELIHKIAKTLTNMDKKNHIDFLRRIPGCLLATIDLKTD